MKSGAKKPLHEADRLLASAREAPLRYDVARGLSRHHARIEQGAALPPWAATSSQPWLASVVAKCLVGAVIAGVAIATWTYYRGAADRPTPPPMAARERDTSRSTLAVEPTGATHAALDAPADPSPQHVAPLESPRVAKSPKVRAGQPKRRIERATVENDELAPAPAPLAPAPRATQPVSRAVESASHSEQVAPPSPPVRPATDPDEMQQLARAEHALGSDPSRALSLARAGDARFPDGYFHQERTYVAIIALTKLGRSEEASALAKRFFASYPASPYRQRLERALSSREVR